MNKRNDFGYSGAYIVFVLAFWTPAVRRRFPTTALRMSG